MSIIVNRIEKLFPDLRLENAEDNILLQTIRVPKKLLFLTNRLPKANYEVKENNRCTTIADYLAKKYKGYYSNKQNYKKSFAEYPKLVPINTAKINLNLKNPEVLKKIPSREHIGSDYLLKKKVIEKPLQGEGRYSPDAEFKMPKREIKKLPRPSNKLQGLENENIMKLLHDKYVKRNPIAKQNIEIIPYINKSTIEPIVKQAIRKNNYIRKAYNLQRLPNIYSYSPQHLSPIVKKLHSPKRPILRHSELSLFPQLRKRQFDNKEKKLNKIISSKLEVKPFKLINPERGIQGIGIESESIQVNILPKV